LASDHLHTEASSSVRLGRALYQQAGASARERERLRAAAAQEWGVPVVEIAIDPALLDPSDVAYRFVCLSKFM
jgi:hypothetical protein